MSFMKYNKALKSGILLKNSLISILKSQKEGLATSLEGNKIIHDVGFAGYSSMVKGSNAFHTRIAKSVKDGAQSLFRGRHIRENRVSLLTPNQLNKCFGGHPMHPCFTRSLASTSAPQPSGQTHQQVVMRSCTTSATQQGSGNGKTNFMSTQNRPLMGGSTGYPNANVEDSALGFDKRESPKGVVDNHGWDDVEKLKAELRGQKGFIGRSINSIQPPEEQNKKDFIVHFRSIRNNAFVTVTDAKGNKKIGASAGSLEEFRGGARLSRYAAQACAEHVGRISRNLGMTSVVMKVKGFTFFGKKKKTILSWREGYTSGFGGADLPRIVSIRDVTQLPHNGCRLPKKRRI